MVSGNRQIPIFVDTLYKDTTKNVIYLIKWIKLVYSCYTGGRHRENEFMIFY